MPTNRLVLSLAAVATLGVYSSLHGQAFTSVVAFGDSLSDTGNFAQLSKDHYFLEIPGPLADYTVGRFTDGFDTFPAARRYKGVWVEQLAASLPEKPKVQASLDGGEDYAYGGALSTTGTTSISFGPFNLFTDTVKDTRLQVSTYLATKPKITDKTLFVLWSGSNDLLAIPAGASEAEAEAAVKTAVEENLASVQRLVAAGATEILVPNLPPLGEVPELNTNTTLSAEATAAALAYDEALEAGLTALEKASPGKSLHVYVLDTYSLFESLVMSPSLYGLENVRNSAQWQGVDPDTWLFWDELHPTTAGHHLLAESAKDLLTQTAASETALTLGASKASAGEKVTVSAKVTGAGKTPEGVVTFYVGGVPFAAEALNAAGVAEAKYVAGAKSESAYELTAHFAGDAVHRASTSAAGKVTVQ